MAGADRMRAWWYRYGGVWFANAVMVTLVALGLVERGRLGEGPAAPLGFRLTELGRAVFGAPEVAPPPEPAERRCLVIQPNFDVVAYLDHADARTAGLLGRIAESGAAHSGPIQTFRITQGSVYQAEESGLSQARILDFLEQHSRREPPANVLRSIADWSGKRESLSLRQRVTLLGFPTTADRDAYLNDHPGGTACGERFVLADGPPPPVPGLLVSDHLAGGRRTLELDEEGRIHAAEPLDIVQESRLLRIARPPLSASIGWQLTADSMRQAAAGGLKAGVVHRWLKDHLAQSGPSLDGLGHRRLAEGRQGPSHGAGGCRAVAHPRRRTIPGDRDEPTPPPLPARPPGSGLARGQEGRPQGAGRGARIVGIHRDPGIDPRRSPRGWQGRRTGPSRRGRLGRQGRKRRPRPSMSARISRRLTDRPASPKLRTAR